MTRIIFKKTRVFLLKRLLIIAITVFFVSMNSAMAWNDSPGKLPPISNAGPRLLARVCGNFEIEAHFDELKELSGTRYGRTSMSGLKKALESKGLQVEEIQAEPEELAILIKEGMIISSINRSSHLVTIEEICDFYVAVHDPTSPSEILRIPIHIFKDDWDGRLLLVKEKKGRHKSAAP